MITHTSTVSVYVSDQQRALDFYVGKLGFEKRRDDPMGQTRWIEVAPKGAQTTLVITKPMPDMGEADYARAKSLIGGWAGFIFNVDDMEKTHSELSRRGVAFADNPRREPWGWWAAIKDPDGNVIGMHAA